MATIDSLDIQISVQVNRALASIRRLDSQLVSLGRSMGNLTINNNFSRISATARNVTSDFSRMGKSINSNRDSIGRLAKRFLTLGAAVKGVKKLWSSIKISTDYVETLNYFNAAFRQVAENADLSGWEKAGSESAEAYANSFRDRAKQLTEKMTGFEVSDTGELTRTNMPSLGLDPDKTMQYQATFAQMTSSMGATSDAAVKVSNALTMIGADLASVRNMDFDKVWEDMASGLAGMSRTLDKYGVNIRNVNLQQKLNSLGINESIQNINQQDKALLRTIILLESTRYAWGDLSNTINQPANQLRLLTANFQALSRTIGSLFIPTITKVLPYINAMVIALQRFFAWIAKLLGIKLSDFTASMGGISDSASGLLDELDETGDLDGVTDSADKAADAVGDTTDSVKDLEKSLSVLSFDELNQLSAASKGIEDNISGAISTPDIGEDLNKIPDYSDILGSALDDALADYQAAWGKAFANMSNKANEIADKIVEAVKKAWKNADFSDIGAFIGKGIKGALDKIPWDGIKSTAAKIGKSLATLINGAIEVAGLGYSIGNTIAQAINTALTGIDSFAKNLHWESVGRFIGDGINGVLENIDWTTAFSAAKNLGAGLSTAINNALYAIDFSLVGSTVANALNTAIQFALSAGATLDFQEIGLSIADAVNGFFDTFNFGDLAETLNVWVQGIWNAIKTAVSEIDWENVWDGVKEFLSNLDIKTVGIIIGALTIKKILGMHLASTALSIIGASLSQSIAQAIAGKLGVEIAANAGIKTALTTGLSKAFSSISGMKIIDIGTVFGAGNLAEKFAFVSKMLGGIALVATGAFTAISNFVTMLKNGFSWLNEALMVLGTALAAVGAVILGAPALVAAAVAGIVAAIGTIAVVVHDNWEEICDFFSSAAEWFNTNVITPISGFFEGMWKSISGFFSDLWDDVKNIWNAASGWFNTKVATPITNFFKGVWTNVSGYFSRLWEGIKNIWSGVSGWFSRTVIEPVKNAWKNATDAISGFFSGLWRGIANGVVSAMNLAIGSIENGINFMVRGINFMLEGFNSIVSWAADIVGVSWNGVSLVPEVTLSRISAPYLAKGGLVQAPTFANIGENYNAEAILPLTDTRAMSQIAESIYSNAPSSGIGMTKEEIKEAISEAVITVMMNNSANQPPVNVNCYATLKTENDEVLARAVARGQNSLDYRYSPA